MTEPGVGTAGSPGGVIGKVQGSDGWPVEHAVVTVADAGGRQAGRAAVNGDASFAVPGLAAGSYTVIITAPGYQPAARAVMVVAGQPTSLGAVPLVPEARRVLPPEGVWDIDPVHSTVQATGYHLGLSKLRGRFTDFGGRVHITSPPESSAVEVVIQAGSIETDNARRDEHLRSADFLDVERFPTVTFSSTSVEQVGEDRWLVAGALTFRDITNPVQLDVRYLGSGPDPWGGTRAGFTAATELNRDDYEMTWNPTLLPGISVFGRTLRIDIDIQAVQAS